MVTKKVPGTTAASIPFFQKRPGKNNESFLFLPVLVVVLQLNISHLLYQISSRILALGGETGEACLSS
jgi:hypothetical protein